MLHTEIAEELSRPRTRVFRAADLACDLDVPLRRQDDIRFGFWNTKPR